MTVSVKDAVVAGWTIERNGRTCYFWSDACRKGFDTP
jgi:YHS domain-containing protein